MPTKKLIRILVVEDHRAVGEAIEMVLGFLGYNATLVHHGADALEASCGILFDGLLCDIELAGGNGWELIARMKEQGCLPPMVISMSAWTPPGDDATSKQAGCRAHLIKPFRLEELEAALGYKASG